ncbi:MAG: Ig-like domain-containing domain, partial [Limisphaerales bacterium]
MMNFRVAVLARIVSLMFAAIGLFSAFGAPPTGPSLSIATRSAREVQLSWSTNIGGFVLEGSAAVPAREGWEPVTETPVATGEQWGVSLPVTEAPRYFRLRLQGPAPLTRIGATSPADGETGVSITRETVFRFTEPLGEDSTLTSDRLFARAGGRQLLTRATLSHDRRRATLFYLEPLPAGARVEVTLVGNGLKDASGRELDGDGDGVPGGTARIEFDTMSIAAIPGTAVIGQVFASEPMASGNGFTNRPLEGVIITVDGAEERLRAVTDASGFFALDPCPAGRFFVHVDGRPAVGSAWPDGAYHPFVGKTFEAVVGRTNNLAGRTGEIFLPLIQGGTLRPVSPTQSTEITFPAEVLAGDPALDGVRITVPANALYADDGSRGGRVGIAPVAPDRIPSPLPPGLNFPLMITIQTDGP